ncbi:hypothetical protein HDU87_004676 [Geranomyces variabilis]|uniref:Uncharacterized protein n=1 Tax=Geranomyces variabilis TaxID=109894 RepID=A0AAD5TKB8_9FUNG|nr:hypothetical protein HDU87_004676 [Geranomyces variabilis]
MPSMDTPLLPSKSSVVLDADLGLNSAPALWRKLTGQTAGRQNEPVLAQFPIDLAKPAGPSRSKYRQALRTLLYFASAVLALEVLALMVNDHRAAEMTSGWNDLVSTLQVTANMVTWISQYGPYFVGPIQVSFAEAGGATRTYYRDSPTSEWKCERLPLGDNPLVQNVVSDFWRASCMFILYGCVKILINSPGRAHISLLRSRLVIRPTMGRSKTFARTDIRDCILVHKDLLLLTFSDYKLRRELFGLDDTVDLTEFLSQMHGLYYLWQHVPIFHSHARVPDSVVLIRFLDPVEFKPIQVQVHGLDPRATHAVISNALDGETTDIATEIRKYAVPFEGALY